MRNEAFSTLGKQLDAAPPESLRALDAAALQELADAIEAARRRQAHELAAAGEAAFAHVPRLLRGPIRKVLR